MEKTRFIERSIYHTIIAVRYRSKINKTIENTTTGTIEGMHDEFFVLKSPSGEEFSIRYSQVISVDKPELVSE